MGYNYKDKSNKVYCHNAEMLTCVDTTKCSAKNVKTRQFFGLKR